jgi:hypothetical protein
MTDGTAKPGAKRRMLEQFIAWFSKHCPGVKFTLSDKDPSEIDAFRKEVPGAKHQLCYWHGVRYIEERLAENKPPAYYDPRKAHTVFEFIDPTWAPGVTRGEVEEYFDGRDMEAGENKQGGVREHLQQLREVCSRLIHK